VTANFLVKRSFATFQTDSKDFIAALLPPRRYRPFVGSRVQATLAQYIAIKGDRE
jgi:hypothetical protein